MIQVTIGKSYIPERTYIINVLLSEFLGLQYKLETQLDTKYAYVISWEHKKICFTQDFFPTNEAATYLTKERLPQKDQDYQGVKVLYGKPNIEWSEDEIRCDINLFGSAFFMLTRWEEIICDDTDQHGRFPAKSSIASKFNFLHRPVVNEYVELLWEMLQYLGVPQERKTWKYQLIPTHDVDLPRLWWTAQDKLRSIGSSLLKRRSTEEFQFISKYILQNKDPFDTFDCLMQLSENQNIQSHFFFISGGNTQYDNHYQIEHPVIQDLLQEIDERGHRIGFHPSYDAYNNAAQFGEELERLQAVSPQEVKTGRQHYLRFETPTTWRIWEQYGMEWDSTLGYAEQIGFRCGVCYPFTVFDVEERKALNLKERPLLAMEVSLQQYQQATPEEADMQLQNLVNIVQSYGGEMVLLWHNSSFNVSEWQGYEVVYENFFK